MPSTTPQNNNNEATNTNGLNDESRGYPKPIGPPRPPPKPTSHEEKTDSPEEEKKE
ncbi:hypothetical protein QBC45DRAFT_395195 [Copromyces sp. CBS 386.78]|nr:hypothetical protein QBC45DRAFT_395195 [Copromyces sp. CBS 386.78]